MLQAWLVLPALALVYLLSAPGSLRTRAKQVAIAGLVVVVVSLSWMSVVSLVPAGQRPYVDGTSSDSVFSQVFVYNGYARLGDSELRAVLGPPSPFLTALDEQSLTPGESAATIKPGWDRLLGKPLGRDLGWLAPAALLGGLLVFWDRRRAGRRDRRLACLVLWGTWLLILGVSFSIGLYVNSYYLAAFSPAIAATCGLGADLYWRRRTEPRVRLALLVGLIATAGYGTFLLSGGARVPAWLLPLCLGVSGVGVLVLLAGATAAGRRRAGLLGVVALISVLPFSAATSAVAVSRELGPFRIPYVQTRSAGSPSASVLAAQVSSALSALQQRTGTRIPLATYTSQAASLFILYTGREILPVGGFLGLTPSPTVSQLARYVSSGKLRFVLAPIVPAVHDSRLVWVSNHCRERSTSPASETIEFALFDCSPSG